MHFFNICSFNKLICFLKHHVCLIGKLSYFIQVCVLTLNVYFQAGFLLKYNYESSEDEEVDIHTTRLNIFSPFDALKLLDITAFIELQDTLYNSSFTLLTEQSRLTAGGHIEVIWLCITEF